MPTVDLPAGTTGLYGQSLAAGVATTVNVLGPSATLLTSAALFRVTNLGSSPLYARHGATVTVGDPLARLVMPGATRYLSFIDPALGTALSFITASAGGFAIERTNIVAPEVDAVQAAATYVAVQPTAPDPTKITAWVDKTTTPPTVKGWNGTAWVAIGGGGGGTVSDATTAAKGIVQLAGDLAGTAAAPTVPGLASKATTAALTSGLAGKADLVGGLVPTSQIPALVNPTDVGTDIVLLWGQSNMRGQNTGYDTVNIDNSDPRIRVLAGAGSNVRQPVLAIEPMVHQDYSAGVGPGLPFARHYLGAVNPNRRVLLVASAYGGTAFETASGSTQNPLYWKITTPDDGTNLYKNAIRQAKLALALAGPNSRIVAILWHQGESDAINGTSGTIYQADLDALIDAARTDLGNVTLPFVVGEMLPENAEGANPLYTALQAVHVGTPSRKTKAAFAYAPWGMNSSADGLHFSAPGQRILGRNFFDAYLVAKGTIATPAAPGQVTGVAATANAATMALSWTAVDGATSYRVEYKATASGTWLSGGGTHDVILTVSGLSSSTSYDFRVTARNYAGNGTTSATLTKSTTGPNPAATAPSTSGLIAWYKPDAGVTTSSGKVTAVADQSGSGNNLAQATTADQPTFSATGLNGVPAFTFAGAQGLKATTNGLTGQPTTILAVVQQNASPTTAGTVVLLGDPTGGRQYRIDTNGLQHVLSSSTADWAYSSSVVPTAAPHVVGIRMSASAATFYKDGPANGVTNSTAPTFANTNGLQIGYKSTIEGFNGVIAEVRIFNRALTDAEITAEMAYLGARYGIPVS